MNEKHDLYTMVARDFHVRRAIERSALAAFGYTFAIAPRATLDRHTKFSILVHVAALQCRARPLADIVRIADALESALYVHSRVHTNASPIANDADSAEDADFVYQFRVASVARAIDAERDPYVRDRLFGSRGDQPRTSACVRRAKSAHGARATIARTNSPRCAIWSRRVPARP